ncbi:hypothetical protein F66182_10357 [Fusarium sp. NRRL 66182]|nr:hypothetical protein F66182_10357 [Fusarium sp. NRRL 66182]
MKLLVFGILASLASADVGTAGFYSDPYLSTACTGDDSSGFPTDNLFIAAGDGIWDNGASCGRQYLVRCISTRLPNACKQSTIQVKVVDRWDNRRTGRKSSPRATMLLSNTAWDAIVDRSKRYNEVNIEFQQV